MVSERFAPYPIFPFSHTCSSLQYDYYGQLVSIENRAQIATIDGASIFTIFSVPGPLKNNDPKKNYKNWVPLSLGQRRMSVLWKLIDGYYVI